MSDHLLLGVGLVVIGAGALGLGRRSRPPSVGRTRVSGRDPVPRWVTGLLRALDLSVEPRALWSSVRAGGPTLVAWSVLAGMVSIATLLVIAALVGLVVLVVAAWRRRTANRRSDTDLLAAVDVMAASVRSGASLHQAVALAGAGPGGAAAGLRAAAATSAHGVPIGDALDAWRDGAASDGPSILVDATVLAAGAGGDLAAALDSVADTLRARAALDREVRALAGQARASAVVLVAAPVLFGAAVAVVDPRVARLLVGTPLGWGCLLGGAALDAVGFGWMSRLARSVR